MKSASYSDRKDLREAHTKNATLGWAHLAQRADFKNVHERSSGCNILFYSDRSRVKQKMPGLAPKNQNYDQKREEAGGGHLSLLHGRKVNPISPEQRTHAMGRIARSFVRQGI
jgi:hypothetical protein